MLKSEILVIKLKLIFEKVINKIRRKVLITLENNNNNNKDTNT